jgi:hypothetical protein
MSRQSKNPARALNSSPEVSLGGTDPMKSSDPKDNSIEVDPNTISNESSTIPVSNVSDSKLATEESDSNTISKDSDLKSGSKKSDKETSKESDTNTISKESDLKAASSHPDKKSAPIASDTPTNSNLTDRKSSSTIEYEAQLPYKKSHEKLIESDISNTSNENETRTVPNETATNLVSNVFEEVPHVKSTSDGNEKSVSNTDLTCLNSLF